MADCGGSAWYDVIAYVYGGAGCAGTYDGADGELPVASSEPGGLPGESADASSWPSE